MGLLAVVSVLAPSSAFAADSTRGSTERLEQGQTHNGLYVRAAEAVRIDGVVNGDVFVAAESFVLKGTINGNLYVVAAEARVDGAVSGNMHIAAGSVEMNGSATSSYLVSSDVTFGSESKLSGSLVTGSSQADIAGSITQGVYIAASSVTFNASTTGSVKIEGSSIKVGRDAQIGGDLRYSQAAQIDIANDQNIDGSISQFGPAKKQNNDWVPRASGALFGLVSSFILGAVMLLLAPKTVIATADYVRAKPGQSVLTGFGFLVLAPVVLLMTLVTLVGIPLALIGAMLYVAILIISHIFVALLVGRTAIKADSKKQHTPTANLLPLLVGLALTGVIELLPILGGMVSFFVMIAGMGALVARSWQRLSHVGKLQRSV